MAGTLISGRVTLEPRSGLGFPWATLEADDTVAELGRYSAINVFIGRGQRIRVQGETWRLKGRSWQKFVCPILLDSEGRKLATSAPGLNDYAITCRDRGFTLGPTEKRPGRPRTWELLEYDEPIGTLRRNPYHAEFEVPVPLPAVLMSFGLAVLGVMGEKDLVAPSMWAGLRSR